jgi:hypothetical protein
MINEFRTLLLNAAGPADLLRPGEEFLPLEFAPRRLTGPLQRIHRLLFGTTPDWLMRNYRADQLLPLVHQSALRDAVTDLDPRVSYSLLPVGDWRYGSVFGSAADTVEIFGDSQQLFVQGSNTVLPDRSGICRYEWRVVSESDDEVTITGLTGTTVTATLPITFGSDGFSQALPLPPLQMTFRCVPDFDRNWSIRIYRRPQLNPGQLLSDLKTLGLSDLLQLWKTADTEPLQSCRELFDTSPEFSEQLAAVLIAFVYSARALPAQG